MATKARRTTVIVNLRARGLAREGPLRTALVRPRDGVHVVVTRTGEELDRAAREAVTSDAVVLAGGDGSYMAGVTALARAAGGAPLPAVALAPGGTVSTVAKNWGMPRGGPRALARYASALVRDVASGAARVAERPTLKVTDATGARVGFIAGAGLVSRFFEIYEAEGAGGYAGAARIVARVFGGSFVGGSLAARVLTPSACELRVDGATAPFDRVSLVCASVVGSLGLGMRLLYRAAEERDRFHVVATPLGPSRLGPQMPRVVRGRPLRGPRVDQLARAVSLRFPAGEGAYVLDGELLRSDVLDVAPGPVLRVLGLARPDARLLRR